MSPSFWASPMWANRLLLNSLVGEERAIVTDIPGTTRDVVEVPATVRGIPLRLADTAGIRQSLNKIEQLGIERARVLAERADLVLLVLDRSRPLGPEDRQLLAAADAERTIVALNKSDLPGTVQPEDIRSLGVPAYACFGFDRGGAG